jgi:hypothetical protein
MYSIFLTPFIPQFAFQKANSQHHTHSSKTAIAATTPNPSAPCTLNALDPFVVVDFTVPALVVEEPDVPPEVPELPEVPEVPPDVDVASPGRLAVAWAARAWKAERVLFVAALLDVSTDFQEGRVGGGEPRFARRPTSH